MDDNLRPLLQKAFFYLKFRSRTHKEVEDYLNNKIKTTHWSSDNVKQVLKYLIELDFINDKKFIEQFVEQRKLLKPKGKKILIQELHRHGIDKQLINDYFSEYKADEEKIAQEILKRRWSRYINYNRQKRYEKAAGFLARRGFDFGAIKKAISLMENN